MAPLRVLLVEDEVLAAMLLIDVLEDAGFTVAHTATEFSEGMAVACEGDFDLALLDVNLAGGKQSFGIAEQLRAQGIPFAFVTSYGGPVLRERFPSVPVLQKPFDPRQLHNVMQSLGPSARSH